MTVGELMDLLSEYDGDLEVVMQSTNSRYVDGVARTKRTAMRPFWGRDDREVLVIVASEQEGAI